MSITLVATNKNVQAGMPKRIVLDLEWFNGNQTKFEDQWKEIRLFLKSNRVITTDDRITAILAYLRGEIADIYAQKKLDEINNEEETQNWKDFV